MSKPKFDKYKCRDCRYHGCGCGGYTARVGRGTAAIYCDYISITGESCLKYNGTDIRGNDFDNCKLFDPGNVNREVPQLVLGSKRR